MSEAVVYRGGGREFLGDKEVNHVTVAEGFTEIKEQAFRGCEGLTNLSFLEDSAVMTVGMWAFAYSGIVTLLGMEGVRKICCHAFAYCEDLRTIEGLGCEEMGHSCFAWCTLLQSMKGWPASMTVIPAHCFARCTGMTTVDCNLSRVTSIGPNAFVGCTSLLPPSLAELDADPAAVLTFLKRKAFLETPAGAAELELEAEHEAARVAELESAARAAEDSLLAELDAEDAAKKGGKKKKKKKKKASGKKGAQQAEPADWRTDFQRYVQSDMMQGVEQRKRQRNLEEAARIMAVHEQKIAALPPPPSLDPAPPTRPAPPDALAETMEDIEAQIAALGLPPDFDPPPPPAAPHSAAPDAFMETLLATAPPPAPAQQSLTERVRSLHLEVCGEEPPAGIGVAAAVALVEEGLLGGAREGGVRERVGVLEETLSG
ncbi:hypothetical protein TeGR_g1232 [Tetraparma gracilis]|uniref:Leucine-rich repeat protein n=1 Tax=Tetraparma gracilis TaxID=2962635 RepID=A0ABQ6MKJ7_9STRA|nr:hypothetical protein TeGR_g1232 [Tetraparma gracilis]